MRRPAASDRFPASDPVVDLVSPILELVPASDWAFCVFAADGGIDRFASSSTALDEAWWRRQAPLRSRAHTGYRVTPIFRSLGCYGSGVTLTFADCRTEFAALTLLRTPELGPFDSGETRLLIFALDWASERFSTLRLMESQEPPRAAWEPAQLDRLKEARDGSSALYVLDQNYAIVLAWSTVPEETAAIAASETRLPARIERSVRELTRGWANDVATRRTGVARPTPFLIVLTQPLAGPAGFFIGVVLQLFKEPHSLTAAADRFSMSPREAQVLALLLDGAQIPEVGNRLFITSSTVQDHIKSLLHKTSSQNRSQMIAKVLGWSPG